MTKLTQPSEFQKRISGEWHGLPSTFDAEGNHLGYDKVYRESAFDPATGATRYTMHTNFHGMSSVDFHRLNTPDGFDFSVRDSDQDRIYLGPDFYGSGQPYGGVVDSQYYSPFWAAELNTLNWVLDDGQTQVYSSLLYEGPALKYVFNVLQDTTRWSNLLFLIRDYVMYVHRRWHSVREGMIFNY